MLLWSRGMNATLLIRDYMTPAPHSVGVGCTLADAHRLMRANRIRHLPVLDGGALVGVVAQSDLHLVETLKDVRPDEVTVEEAMTQDAYTVPPNEPLARVCDAMHKRKLGSAVVVDRNERVLGVFTTNDALRVLARLTAARPRAKARKAS